MSIAVDSPADLAGAIGRTVIGEWFEIDQERIAAFADATEDWQWIHLDAERAASGPFGATIAHGYLTLSLLPRLTRGLVRGRRHRDGRELRPRPGAVPAAGRSPARACAP